MKKTAKKNLRRGDFRHYRTPVSCVTGRDTDHYTTPHVCRKKQEIGVSQFRSCQYVKLLIYIVKDKGVAASPQKEPKTRNKTPDATLTTATPQSALLTLVHVSINHLRQNLAKQRGGSAAGAGARISFPSHHRAIHSSSAHELNRVFKDEPPRESAASRPGQIAKALLRIDTNTESLTISTR